MNRIFEFIKQELSRAKTAVVAAHVDPDGDTLGSMIALALMLKKLGIKAVMYSVDGVPRSYKFLPHSDEVYDHPPKYESDLLITVDASDVSRIGAHPIKAKKIINIDHHPDNTNFGNINCVELLSAVAELIYQLAEYLKIDIDPEIATALYVSIITDTGNFKYANTLPSTFEVAMNLVKRGANPSECATAVYDNKTLVSVKIFARALLNVETLKNGRVVYAAISNELIREMHAHGEDIVGVIDHLRTIDTAEVAVMLREEVKNKIKVNFRSKRAFNVSRIAKALGGGGHIQAAGAVIEGPLEEVKKKVLDLILAEF